MGQSAEGGSSVQVSIREPPNSDGRSYKLLVIESYASVNDSSPYVRGLLTAALKSTAQQLQANGGQQPPEIKVFREMVKRSGWDPSRYRISSDALYRRLMQGKPVESINNIVDLNNYLSLICGFPVGSYDRQKIVGEVFLKVAAAGDECATISKGVLSIAGLPALFDSQGPFGSPVNDSARTMITSSCSQVLTVVYGVNGFDLASLHEPIEKTFNASGLQSVRIREVAS